MYDSRFMTQDEIEKAMLIDELVKTLPYPRSWFQRRTLAQLIAIYHKPSPKNKKMVETKPTPNHSPDLPRPEPLTRINEETGEREIKTDGGYWEILDD